MKWIDSIGTESASGVEHGSLLSWVYSAPMLRRGVCQGARGDGSISHLTDGCGDY